MTDMEYTLDERVIRKPTHDTPEAVLIDALDPFDVVDYRIDPHGRLIDHREAAAAILAAMPDWTLVPRVATADWTGSTKRADDAERLRVLQGAFNALWSNGPIIDTIADWGRDWTHDPDPTFYELLDACRKAVDAVLAPMTLAPSEP